MKKSIHRSMLLTIAVLLSSCSAELLREMDESSNANGYGITSVLKNGSPYSYQREEEERQQRIEQQNQEYILRSSNDSSINQNQGCTALYNPRCAERDIVCVCEE
ncbi:hypothetical protein [Marinomonas sp. PE14-40]|uniref:hypothetical protein n=1 Tax=Marinomonas sp. PE14-40 TaxID=3060621 RepID=UPI003F6629B0